MVEFLFLFWWFLSWQTLRSGREMAVHLQIWEKETKPRWDLLMGFVLVNLLHFPRIWYYLDGSLLFWITILKTVIELQEQQEMSPERKMLMLKGFSGKRDCCTHSVPSLSFRSLSLHCHPQLVPPCPVPGYFTLTLQGSSLIHLGCTLHACAHVWTTIPCPRMPPSTHTNQNIHTSGEMGAWAVC